jgi:hypothetical protein
VICVCELNRGSGKGICALTVFRPMVSWYVECLTTGPPLHESSFHTFTTFVPMNKHISSSIYVGLRVKSCGLRVAYDMYDETLVVQ